MGPQGGKVVSAAPAQAAESLNKCDIEDSSDGTSGCYVEEPPKLFGTVSAIPFASTQLRTCINYQNAGVTCEDPSAFAVSH